MRWSVDTDFITADRIPQYVIGFGAAVTLVMLGEILLLTASGSPYVTDGAFLIGVVTVVPFLVGIVYGGYWLDSSRLSPPRYLRVVGWLFSGLVVFLLINLALIAAVPTDRFAMVVAWIRWAVALGAGIGLLIGCIEARTIERSLAAERASLRATHLEEQREFLDYLNSILRHEVLNAATIINGYASLLHQEAATTDQHRRWAEIVIDESEEMSTVIDDVQVLLQSVEGEWQLEPVNVSRIVTEEIRKLEQKWDSIDVETSIPADVSVQADELLARVFRNLLSNAVEHNDAARPRVAVTVEPGPETVRVEIADNGSGIPASELDSIEERVESYGSTHGLGLYLVHQLVSRYDGTIELTETGPDGSVFTVELPAATVGKGS
ncbi:sensor histidine kinase [Natronorubrum halophilum]|uniref:sensor histidine kinase n=1 Tax=Natronorubrum halophilum TaxID=1702106 RepID=UPI000EF6CBC1|nr:HAMP domain-containing sensor histidine kinase [Natronorubrum halophilum]